MMLKQEIYTQKDSTPVKKRILFSLIIPVYNVERYVEICLDSIVSQLKEDIEVICINDGSTDGSGVVLSNYCHYPNFIVISTENRGQGAARNIGIKAASGAYILFIDGDDFIDVNYLSDLRKLVEPYLENDDLDLILVGAKRFDDKKKIFLPDVPYYRTANYGAHGLCDQEVVYARVFEKFAPFFKIQRRRFILQQNLFYDEGVRFEDVVPHVKALLSAKKILISDLASYYYRFNRAGSTMNSSYDIKKISDVFKFLLRVREVLKQMGLFSRFRQSYYIFFKNQVKFHLQKVKPSQRPYVLAFSKILLMLFVVVDSSSKHLSSQKIIVS